MSILTIRLPDPIIEDLNTKAKKLNLSKAQYIRKAIEYLNKGMEETESKKRLIDASQRVRKESMVINSEFEKVEYASKV